MVLGSLLPEIKPGFPRRESDVTATMLTAIAALKIIITSSMVIQANNAVKFELQNL